jgi:2-aminoadipate transaminase
VKSPLSRLGRRLGPPPIAWLMDVALSRPQLISLAAGFTDAESLPVVDTRDLLNGLLRSRKTGCVALQYGSTQGDAALRQLTAARVARADGASEAGHKWSSDRLLITNGSQQLLYLVSEVLCDPGDLIIAEDPTYFVYLGIVEALSLKMRGVPMQNDGLDLTRLEETLASLKQTGQLRRLKMLYAVSYFQNPTGITTSFEKKRAILKLLRKYESAAGHPIYLLEDAAYRELRFSGKDVKSALACPGAGNRVIYAGTYSKPFATGTRVGFGLMPEPVFTAALRSKGNHDFGNSNLPQQLIVRALTSGRYDRHVARIGKRYAAKASVMREALTRHFPSSVKWAQPEGGLYFWARTPSHVQTGIKSKLFETALERHVLYVPGELCYAPDPRRRKPNHEMRLSFGSATEADIRTGIARLGIALQEAGC